MKLVMSVFAMVIAACAVEPTAEQETSVMTTSIGESHDGGVADCGTKCGTLDTPQCPASTARQTKWQTCGTKDTPPCPMAPVSAPQGGPPQCGTPGMLPCPIAAR